MTATWKSTCAKPCSRPTRPASTTSPSAGSRCATPRRIGRRRRPGRSDSSRRIGAKAIFEREPRVMFVSSHQSPLYPGTGDESEHGVGNLFNGILSPGAGSYEFRQLWDEVLLPRLQAFQPQLLLISAGFDAHANDPLADLWLGQDDYAWITERLVAVARQHADSRIVSTLEGGYNLAALASSARAHVRALME